MIIITRIQSFHISGGLEEEQYAGPQLCSPIKLRQRITTLYFNFQDAK